MSSILGLPQPLEIHAEVTREAVYPASPAERAELLLRADTDAVFHYLARRVTILEDASDLLSDSMLVVWRRRRSVPEDPLEARMWFFGIARNVLLTHRRAASRQKSLGERLMADLEAAPIFANYAGTGDDSAEDLRAHVRALVCSLSERDQEIVTLVHWEGFNLEQVAVILSVRSSTVRSRYARARARLKSLLLESDDVADS